MDIYRINDVKELIKDNPYVGRGIIIGKTKDGKKAVSAYFIMGRSENSRNRVFTINPALCSDPSLIIYASVRSYENKLIVTNGDQTDTIYNGLKEGICFTRALKSREFEPDAPNLTPRISGILEFENNDFTYKMSILKSADANGTACNRYTFDYTPLNGLGHFIHTYVTDGNPIPTFQGEPERIEILDDINDFTAKIWDGLNEQNKISLFVRYTDLKTGEYTDKIINKNQK